MIPIDARYSWRASATAAVFHGCLRRAASTNARAAGVNAALELYDGVPHVWQFFDGVVPEATRSMDRAAAFVAAHAGRRGPRHVDLVAGAPA